MRIFNNKAVNLEVPLGNGQFITVPPQGVSGDFLPSTKFLSLMAASFKFEDISLVVNGVLELNACSAVPPCMGFVVYSVSEAVERFHKLAEGKETPSENPANIEVQEKKKKNEKKKDSQGEEGTETPSNS